MKVLSNPFALKNSPVFLVHQKYAYFSYDMKYNLSSLINYFSNKPELLKKRIIEFLYYIYKHFQKDGYLTKYLIKRSIEFGESKIRPFAIPRTNEYNGGSW